MVTQTAQREIIIIPACTGKVKQGTKNRQLRVASYSRVSTDFEEQLTSFYAQKSYYTDLIQRTPEWTLAGTYADEGLSGASAEKRPDFMRMFRHCKQGKIDLIITKSISRFARNTMDSIGYVRKLKAMGVGVIFEKEGINTLEENSEVILTILSSLAQEELNSLSCNVKMGKRMAMQEGKVYFQYKRFYGYRKGLDNQPEIIPEQAEIVRRIFSRYLAGDSMSDIANALNGDGIATTTEQTVWRTSTIQTILENERYCGDVILQKTYITDPITKRAKKNNGELPKVYIKNNHAAIISRETFEQVQQERSRRISKRKVSKNSTTENGKYSSRYALSEVLICGCCLTPYRRVVWTRRNGEKQVVWRCINRLDYGTKYCKDAPTLDEESLQSAIVQAIACTYRQRHELIPFITAHASRTLQEEKSEYVNVEELEKQIEALRKSAMELVVISADAHTVEDNEERLKAISDEMRELHNRVMEYRRRSESESSVTQRVSAIVDALESEPDAPAEYSDERVRQLIDTVKVLGNDRLLVIFKSGLEIEQPLECRVKKYKRT